MRMTPAVALVAIGCILGGACSTNPSSVDDGSNPTPIDDAEFVR